MQGAMPENDFVFDLMSLRPAKVSDLCDNGLRFYFALSLVYRLGYIFLLRIALVELKVSRYPDRLNSTLHDHCKLLYRLFDLG
jgi:hypothetical protein